MKQFCVHGHSTLRNCRTNSYGNLISSTSDRSLVSGVRKKVSLYTREVINPTAIFGRNAYGYLSLKGYLPLTYLTRKLRNNHGIWFLYPTITLKHVTLRLKLIWLQDVISYWTRNQLRTVNVLAIVRYVVLLKKVKLVNCCWRTKTLENKE